MSIPEPSQEDIRKIHAEINQLVHQRFLLTMTAISVFGAIIAWLIPKSPPVAGGSIESFMVEGIILLLVLLFLLYCYSHRLNGMVRILSAYLIITNSSPWEISWCEYRNSHDKYWAYTKPQCVMFMALGLFAASFPISLALAYNLRLDWSYWLIILSVTTFLYELFIWLMGFGKLWSKDGENVKRKWQNLEHSSAFEHCKTKI